MSCSLCDHGIFGSWIVKIKQCSASFGGFFSHMEYFLSQRQKFRKKMVCFVLNTNKGSLVLNYVIKPVGKTFRIFVIKCIFFSGLFGHWISQLLSKGGTNFRGAVKVIVSVEVGRTGGSSTALPDDWPHTRLLHCINTLLLEWDSEHQSYFSASCKPRKHGGLVSGAMIWNITQ